MSLSDNDGGAGSSARAFARPDPHLLRPHIRAGHDLIPLHQSSYVDDQGRPRGKSPRDSNWRRRDYRGEDPAKWMEAGHNVGVRLGTDTVVIDIDDRNFPPGDDVRARFVSDFELDLGQHPPDRDRRRR
ncbi:MAG: hypothetical protein WDM92_05655 [Caulobacteraceae bacterium]